MWIYCNLFVTASGVKSLFHCEEEKQEEHALRRTQGFCERRVDTPSDLYWYMYDQEIEARRARRLTMTLPAFATFFVSMEDRVLRIMRNAIPDQDTHEECVEGVVRFMDSFEKRYEECITRYTDLQAHERTYAWMCLIYTMNDVRRLIALTNHLDALQI